MSAVILFILSFPMMKSLPHQKIGLSPNRAFAAEVVGPSRVESIYTKHRFMQIDIICWCASENDFGGITTS